MLFNKVNKEVPLGIKVIKYGSILTDFSTMDKFYNHIRIRTVRYEDKIYYHKMKNGLVKECKEL